MFGRLCCVLSLTGCLLLGAVALADEIVMDNGDRLTGRIVGLAGGKLAIKTSYSARPIEVDQTKVKSIKSDRPVELHLAGGQIIKGRLSTDEGGVVTAREGQGRGPVSVDWQKVKAINPPKSAWHGSVSIGASDQGGNTERGSASVAAEAQRRTERDRFGLRFLYNYAEEDGAMSARNVFGTLKYDWFFTKKLYGYISEELLSDEFRDLQLRAVTGAGLGWQLVDRTGLFFAAEAGAAHVNEDFELGEDESRVAARLAGSLKWTLFKRVTFSDELVYLPSMEDDQYQVRNEAALTTPLGAGWSLKFANVFEYDSDPPEGVFRTDRTWLLGLQYSF
jgi:putative salt-induced outer membrane protein YdiY